MSEYRRQILPLILVCNIPRYTSLVWEDILSSEHSFTNFHFDSFTIGVYASTGSHLYTLQIFALLMGNGTCTDGIHKAPPQILNNNGINGSFQNLISDNRELAEIICQNLLNGNATINMSPSKIPDVPVTSNGTLN